MAYTPTGKPVGRPKTKDYKTISLKIPQELLDRVQTYARRHRQSLSELIRDGLEWRITEGDPRGLGVPGAQRTPSDDDGYSRNTEIPPGVWGEADHTGLLHEIRAALARQEAQLQALAQALEQHPVVATPSEYSRNTISGPKGQHSTPEPAPEGEGGHVVAHEEIGNTVLQEEIPSFDTSKYALGKLCPRGHGYHDTGKTLLRLPKHVCPQCDAERARKKRQATPA